jgi:hypothetical protein
MDDRLAAQLARLSELGESCDAEEPEHSQRMINITPGHWTTAVGPRAVERSKMGA